MKKNIIVLFAASSLLYASAQTVVIPDADFKAYLVTSFDTDGNGEISAAEAQAVRKIEYTDRPLQSLSGIEAFTALEELDCSYANPFERGGLTQIDVSQNLSLKVLRCDNNSLEQIDVSHNAALRELHCRNNKLSDLDVSGRKELEELLCDNNRLKRLQTADCPSLSLMYCSMNQPSGLPLAALAELCRESISYT